MNNDSSSSYISLFFNKEMTSFILFKGNFSYAVFYSFVFCQFNYLTQFIIVTHSEPYTEYSLITNGTRGIGI
jgi:hypothetical protein